jgi:AraC-like DNA-binding protein
LPDTLRDMSQAAAPPVSVVLVRSAAALISAIRDGTCRTAVVDPSGLTDEIYADLVAAIATAGVSFVIWAPLLASTVTRVLYANRFLRVEVLFRGFEDEARLLRIILKSAGMMTAPARILAHVSDRFQRLPSEIGFPTVALFGWGPLPATVHEFARLTLRDLRTVERHLRAEHLCSPGRLLHIARLSRAHVLLQNPSMNLGDAAEKVGYQSSKALSLHYRSVTGASPRQSLGAIEFASRSVKQLICSANELRSDEGLPPAVGGEERS